MEMSSMTTLDSILADASKAIKQQCQCDWVALLAAADMIEEGASGEETSISVGLRWMARKEKQPIFTSNYNGMRRAAYCWMSTDLRDTDPVEEYRYVLVPHSILWAMKDCNAIVEMDTVHLKQNPQMQWSATGVKIPFLTFRKAVLALGLALTFLKEEVLKQ